MQLVKEVNNHQELFKAKARVHSSNAVDDTKLQDSCVTALVVQINGIAKFGPAHAAALIIGSSLHS